MQEYNHVKLPGWPPAIARVGPGLFFLIAAAGNPVRITVHQDSLHLPLLS